MTMDRIRRGAVSVKRHGSGNARRPQRGADDGKMRQILDGARAVFLADGFDGASMNEIARAAGVSKGTLYVYFPSKVGMFEALIRHDRSLQAEQTFQFGQEDDDDLAKVLTRIGVGLMREMCKPDHLAHVRMVVGAVAKYPQIGQAFFEAGPKAGAQRLGGYLERQAAAGRIAAPADAELAADQFIQLCQAGYYKEALFCVAAPDNRTAIATAVAEAVTTFLRAYREGCRPSIFKPSAAPRDAPVH
jgi:AcrR family transcriptional regulator